VPASPPPKPKPEPKEHPMVEISKQIRRDKLVAFYKQMKRRP
jgi:hypothetical protein